VYSSVISGSFFSPENTRQEHPMAPNVIQVLSFGRCGNCQLVKFRSVF